MHSTLIVARMDPGSRQAVADLFARFDASELPGLMGTRRRELFHYRGLYFHLQDFDGEHGGEAIQEARTHPGFIGISADLKPFIEAYDPSTWRSPKDAMATRFYHWEEK
ncbi:MULTISPECIES: TcmI family type II polyketide cyclase [unclassified Amycolatopsis]|uniref:TcmI family type II polyketide cyclase n=1 Tax=unclassified Amycolatopsis TaxID=2618356 RepID=UPI002876417E|nr:MULTISPECIES: TcmI family type II polyketide cyclase [unclassified Amycolatopsis]MDS0135817.1 TcmI family type II polyketide cyclase [Amycolatopsis sp. 505]MDS0145582.1 TcmI family type II polyketide cyclase [Amycolatopsis sp. CM201R]